MDEKDEMDVGKVERELLALYKKMVGPGVWPAGQVKEFNDFARIINACVFEFWYTTGEGEWDLRWKKKTWVDDEHGDFLREMHFEDEEALIRGKVRLQIQKAAGMPALKAKYSPEARVMFDDILRYVNLWCEADHAVEEEKGVATNSQENPPNPDIKTMLTLLQLCSSQH